MNVAICLLLVGLAALTVPPAAAGPRELLDKPEDWFRSAEGRRAVANVLSHQSPAGSWPKNQDNSANRYFGDPKKLEGTFDNGATTDELRFLARAFSFTRDPACREAFLRGLEHILTAQYTSGGWPQRFPPGSGYARHITFNDGSMVRLMEFLRSVARDPVYFFVPAERRNAGQAAFDRGVQCILKSQIRVEGALTAWCAQHDETDLRPRPARSYELVSLSGSESVGIVRLLMSLERPSPEVIRAVEGAVAWFEKAKLTGIRVIQKLDPHTPKGTDRVVVEDPAAPPLWARFYEIGTNRPIFCDRDGVVKRKLSEIGYERRNGYAWLGTWPEALLAKEFPAWKSRKTGE